MAFRPLALFEENKPQNKKRSEKTLRKPEKLL